MAIFLRNFPYNDDVVGSKGVDKNKATDELIKWAESITRQSEASPVLPQPVTELYNVNANSTGNLGGSEAAGVYRISAYREVTTADPVSSSLALSIAWTHNAKSLTRTLSAFTGAPQATTNTASDVSIIEVDVGTAISYSLTYASNTPGLGQFQVVLAAELIQTVS